MNTPPATSDLIAENCIAVRARLISRAISKVYDDALRPFGLKTSQLNILVVTARLGRARPAEVCSRLKMDLSTVSRTVERLKARGWIRLETDPQDARAHVLRLTEKGAALLDELRLAWESAQQDVGEILGPSGVKALDRVARRIHRMA